MINLFTPKIFSRGLCITASILALIRLPSYLTPCWKEVASTFNQVSSDPSIQSYVIRSCLIFFSINLSIFLSLFFLVDTAPSSRFLNNLTINKEALLDNSSPLHISWLNIRSVISFHSNTFSFVIRSLAVFNSIFPQYDFNWVGDFNETYILPFSNKSVRLIALKHCEQISSITTYSSGSILVRIRRPNFGTWHPFLINRFFMKLQV